jgi:hypothetical protein
MAQPKDQPKDATERPQPTAIDAAPFAELAPEQQVGAVTPSQWTPQLTDQVPISTPHWDQPGLFGHNTPRKSHSIHSEDDDAVRYELRAGETYTGTWPDTPPTERCEMGQHHRYNVRGNSITVDYEWMVEPGPAISSAWLTCGQLHSALSASPPTEIMFHANDRMEVSANSGSSKSPRWNTAWSDDKPIERGHWYKMRLQQQQGTPGKVRLWRDGVLVCEYDGDVGYTDQTQTYWKQGIYRKRPDGGETVAMWYRGLKITEGLQVPSEPNHGPIDGGSGPGPTPEPETKVVRITIDQPAGVHVEVEILET